MSRLVQAAWLLPALWLIAFAARVFIADLRSTAAGEQSWSECCLDARDGWACDCLIPAQREAS